MMILESQNLFNTDRSESRPE